MSNGMTSKWSPDSPEEENQADESPVTEPEQDPFEPTVERKRFRLKSEADRGSGKSDSVRDITGDFSFSDGDIESENKNRHARDSGIFNVHTDLKRKYRGTDDRVGGGAKNPAAGVTFIIFWLPSLIIGLAIAWFFKDIPWMILIGILIAISPLWMANRYYREATNYGDPEWDDEANAYLWTRIIGRMTIRFLRRIGRWR